MELFAHGTSEGKVERSGITSKVSVVVVKVTVGAVVDVLISCKKMCRLRKVNSCGVKILKTMFVACLT